MGWAAPHYEYACRLRWVSMSLNEFDELLSIKSTGQLFHCLIVLAKKELLYSVVEAEIQRYMYWWFARVLLSAVTTMFSVLVYRHFRPRRTLQTQDTSDLWHFGPWTPVRKTLRTGAEVSGHFGTILWKIVLHLRISELLLLMWLNAVTVDVWSRLKCVDPLSPSVFAMVCRLFEVNRDSTVHMHLVTSTHLLPVEQGTHCALQLLIVIISDWSLPAR